MPGDVGDLAFVVPSYRRPEECMKRTVSLLAKHGIKPTVYLSDPAEAGAYEEAARDHGLEGCVDIAPGLAGLPQNRNHIRRTHPEGSYIVSLDDDVSSIQRLSSSGKKLADVDLQGLFCGAHDFCLSRGVTLWGVYPVRNAFFMSNRIRFGNHFIGGAVYMEKVLHSPVYDVCEGFPGTRDDIERTLIHDDCGTVARFEFITHDTDYLNLRGGLQSGVRDEDSHVDWILASWPHKTKGWRRKDGRREVKLLAKVDEDS